MGVESRDSRSKEKTYVRALVDGYRGSPKEQFRCWQCDKPGHKSADCPKGERCFTCNSQGHKRAECPIKRKATRQEKGKALGVGLDLLLRHCTTTGISIGEQLRREKVELTNHVSQQGKGVVRREAPMTERKEWRQVPETKTKQTNGPRRLNEAGEANLVLRPGRQNEDLQGKKQVKVNQGLENETRIARWLPVFMVKSETTSAERDALLSTGGIITKVNGNPSVRDYIEALKKMSSSYATWSWNPIPVAKGTLFKFPTEGETEHFGKEGCNPLQQWALRDFKMEGRERGISACIPDEVDGAGIQRAAVPKI